MNADVTEAVIRRRTAAELADDVIVLAAVYRQALCDIAEYGQRFHRVAHRVACLIAAQRIGDATLRRDLPKALDELRCLLKVTVAQVADVGMIVPADEDRKD